MSNHDFNTYAVGDTPREADSTGQRQGKQVVGGLRIDQPQDRLDTGHAR